MEGKKRHSACAMRKLREGKLKKEKHCGRRNREETERKMLNFGLATINDTASYFSEESSSSSDTAFTLDARFAFTGL